MSTHKNAQFKKLKDSSANSDNISYNKMLPSWDKKRCFVASTSCKDRKEERLLWSSAPLQVQYIHVVGAKEIKFRMTWNRHILANNIYWAAHVCFDLWTCQGLFPSQRLCQVQCNTLFAGDRDIANSISHGATCMMHVRLNRYFSNLPLFGKKKQKEFCWGIWTIDLMTSDTLFNI